MRRHRADLVIADRLIQCIELGEIHHVVEAGRSRADASVEPGAVVQGVAARR